MKYAPQYCQSAIAIISLYQGDTPLAIFLKQFFAQQKKYGSKDRKWITHLCYTYYRIGHALPDLPIADRLKVAIFLSHDEPGEWYGLFTEEWINHWNASIDNRMSFIRSVYIDFTTNSIFPQNNELSTGIDTEKFSLSHLIQPDLFLRIRPGKTEPVLKKLNGAGIVFTQLSDTCLALPNASKIDAVLEIDKEVVIQDKSSQKVAAFLEDVKEAVSLPVSVWDCCAASGGKSILAEDVLKDIHLTVSDIRLSILHNLQQRFQRAGLNNYQAFVADLAKEQPQMASAQFIIVDAPCTGSGTWGRTPEQLYFFTQDKLAGYVSLQQKIVDNVKGLVEQGGYLLYITCSVFREENEAMVERMQTDASFELVQSEVLAGYTEKADTMFAALFAKN